MADDFLAAAGFVATAVFFAAVVFLAPDAARLAVPAAAAVFLVVVRLVVVRLPAACLAAACFSGAGGAAASVSVAGPAVTLLGDDFAAVAAGVFFTAACFVVGLLVAGSFAPGFFAGASVLADFAAVRPAGVRLAVVVLVFFAGLREVPEADVVLVARVPAAAADCFAAVFFVAGAVFLVPVGFAVTARRGDCFAGDVDLVSGSPAAAGVADALRGWADAASAGG